MQSFSTESAPQVKRRKLEHDAGLKSVEIETDDRDNVSGVNDELDHVVEEEEGPETATEGQIEEDDGPEDATDPFETHFADPDDNVLTKKLNSLQKNEWAFQKASLSGVGKAVIGMPQKEVIKSYGGSPIPGPNDLKLKQKLASVINRQRPSFDTLESQIAPYIFGYHDILFCERSPQNSESLRRLACLHAVNHVFK